MESSQSVPAVWDDPDLTSSGSTESAVRIMLLASLIVFLSIAFLLRAYTVDDAYISLRYAQNLAHGHGLVYSIQGGERVEAYTKFLWVLV